MAHRFIILSTLIVAAFARPEYNYPRPTGFGGGISGGSISSGGGYVGGGGISLGGGGGGIGLGGGGGGGGGYVSGGGISGGFTSGGFTSGGISGGGISGGGISGGGGIVGGGITTGVTNVHRHIYVYGPPEQDEVQQQRQVISGGQAQKHYKIIFIKTPSYSLSQQAQIELARQNEEKTIVYVLVKKPEEQGDIQINTPAPTAPSKPEVYFIKYKTNKATTGGVSTGGIATGGISTGGISTGISTGGIATGGIGGISTGGISTGVKPQYGVPGYTK